MKPAIHTPGTVAVAGATGFVGRELIRHLARDGHVIALTRGESRTDGNVEWRAADFFSVDAMAHALAGTQTAVYLVHSMLPTSRLDQSRFEDTDLWLADTFAHAAARAGVQKIVYLGGLIPDVPQLSPHLASRLEVESALASAGVPVVSLRAGLILGAEGSSFQILYLLVKRLPWMLCPRWAWTPTQAVALEDVVRSILECMDPRNATPPGAYDLGVREVTTYRELMWLCAQKLGLKRRFLNVPLFTPGLSVLWVCAITGASPKLVAPLVKSMVYPMLVRDRRWIDRLESAGPKLKSASDALELCLRAAVPQLRGETRQRRRARRLERGVRSIQRLSVPVGWSAAQVAQAYFSWLQRKFRGWVDITTRTDGGVWIGLRGPLRRWPLLEFTVAVNVPQCMSYQIAGGLLVAPGEAPGVFEFRVAAGGRYGLVGLHRYRPRLPWGVYKWTQAIGHLAIMRSFANCSLRVWAPKAVNARTIVKWLGFWL